MEIPFEIIEYLSQETDELVWTGFLNRISFFYESLVTTSAYGDYQKFMRTLVAPLYNQLGWIEKENDTWLQKLVKKYFIVSQKKIIM